MRWRPAVWAVGLSLLLALATAAQARTLQAAPGADGDLQEGAPTDREEPPSAAPTPAPAPAVELEELTVDSGAALLNQINLTGMVLVDPRPANEYDGVCDGADCQNMADGRPYCCRDSRRTWFFKSPRYARCCLYSYNGGPNVHKTCNYVHSQADCETEEKWASWYQ